MINGFAPNMTTARQFEVLREPGDAANGVITLWIHDAAGTGEKVKPNVTLLTNNLMATRTVNLNGIPPSGRLSATKNLEVTEFNGNVTIWIISQSTGDQSSDGYQITVNTQDFVNELQRNGILINW